MSRRRFNRSCWHRKKNSFHTGEFRFAKHEQIYFVPKQKTKLGKSMKSCGKNSKNLSQISIKLLPKNVNMFSLKHVQVFLLRFSHIFQTKSIFRIFSVNNQRRTLVIFMQMIEETERVRRRLTSCRSFCRDAGTSNTLSNWSRSYSAFFEFIGWITNTDS